MTRFMLTTALLGISAACGPVEDFYTARSYAESYGECVGYCGFTLDLSNGVLNYTATTNEDDQSDVTTTGQLTQAGMDRLEALQIDSDQQFDEVYGCPDCDDGGAAELELELQGVLSTVRYEAGNPPEALAAAEDLFIEIMGLVEECAASDLYTLDDGCRPLDD